MSQVIEIQLEWKYTPKNYLEEAIQIEQAGYVLSIANGIALAKIEPTFYSQNFEIEEHLTSVIKSRLQAIQIMFHKDFILSKPNRRELKKDGTRNLFLRTRIEARSHTPDSVDFVVRDKDGKIVADTKQERLDKQERLAERIGKYQTDKTLAQMLKSYRRAVKDPKDELVHLYEIRDALSARFGKDKKAMRTLDINKKDWKIIGNLANNEPLKEGRHRGKSVGILRPAKQTELELARKTAGSFIEKYLLYLENNQESPLKTVKSIDN